MNATDCGHCQEGLIDPCCPVHGMPELADASTLLERRAREIAGEGAAELIEWKRQRDVEQGRRDALARQCEHTAREGGALSFIVRVVRLVAVALAATGLATHTWPLLAVNVGAAIIATLLIGWLQRAREDLNAAAGELRGNTRVA